MTARLGGPMLLGMRSPLLVTIVLGGLILGLAPGRAAADPFLPVDIVRSGGPGARGVKVAVDRTGAEVVAWTELTGNGGAGEVRASYKPAGGTFSPPVSLSGSSQDASHPAVALDGAGNALVAWDDGDDVAAAEQRAGAPGFSPLGKLGGGDSPSAGFTSDGSVIVAWRRGVDIVSAVRTAGGTFPSPSRLDGDGDIAGTPRVATAPDSDDAVVVWSAALPPTSSSRLVARRRDPATGFGAAEKIAEKKVETFDVALRPSGGLEVAWLAKQTGGAGGQFSQFVRAAARSAGAGGAFTAPQTIDSVVVTDAATQQSVRKIAVGPLDGGGAVVSWSLFNGLRSASSLRGAARPDADGSYAPPAPVFASTDSATEVVSVDVAGVGGDRAVAVFDRGSTVAASAFGLDGGFGAVRGVAPSGVRVTDVAVASDPQGDAAAAYDRNNNEVGVATIDATAPELRDVSVPDRVAAGSPATFAATAFDGLTSASAPAWDFGDGVKATGAAVEHAYESPGTYTVTVSTNDAAGNAATRSATVTVPEPPTQEAPQPQPQPQPAPVPQAQPQEARQAPGPPRPAPVPAPVTPAVGAVKLKPATFSAKRGTNLRYSLSVPAQVSIRVERKVRGRFRTAGTLAPPSRRGTNKLAFDGRVRNKALAPGSYRMTIVATAGGRTSKPRSVPFKVVR